MGIIGKRIASGLFFGFSEEFLAQVVSFAGSVIIVRMLSPQEYGVVAVTLSLPQLLVGLTDLGLSQAIIRFGSRGRWGEALSGTLLRTVVAIVTGSVFVLFPNAIASFLNRPYIATYLWLMAIYVVARGVLQAVTSLLMGAGLFEYVAIARVAQSIIRVVASVALLLAGFRVTAVLLGHAISYSLQLVLALVFIAPYILSIARRGNDFQVSVRGVTNIAAFSLPLIAPSLVSLAANPYLTVLTAKYSSNQLMGNLQVAGIFLTLLTIVTGAVGRGVLAGLSSGRTKEVIDVAMAKAVKYSTAIIAPVASALIFFSKPLVWTIYGARYAFAPLMLSIAAVNGLGVALGSYTLGQYFMAIGDTKRLGLIGALTTAICALIGTVLIARYGAWGTVWSLVVGHYLGTITTLAVASRVHGLKLNLRGNVAVLSASIIAGAALYPLTYVVPPKFWGISLLIPYGILYMGLIIALFKIEEFEELRRLAGNISLFGPWIAKLLTIAVTARNLLNKIIS